jgi:hypothetical protein
VSTKSISTSIPHSACDVCGRTLLRGERADVYLSGGSRRSVCELCISRAVHGGWVREGTVPEYAEGDSRVDRRRSLLSRLRSRRETGNGDGAARELAGVGEEEPPARAAPAAPDSGSRSRTAEPIREPRHVRAVPTSVEQKVASAVDLFNSSEHPRTVAGVARSLGMPDVAVQPSEQRASVVNVVVSWELCWYRYEADLSDEVPTVRVAGQGYELDELDEAERRGNATADERGRLALSG